MKYEFISEYRTQYRLSSLCRVLGVSRSGYYSFLEKRPSQRAEANQELEKRIGELFGQREKRYGSPRILLDLQEEGRRCGKNRVARLMRKNGLIALTRRRFKVTTRKDPHLSEYAPDRLQRQFTVEEPNKVWTSDITYIWTKEGWLYLAVVLDLCTRSVVGWADSARITSDLVCDALTMALERRHPDRELILHSDRGSQYTSEAVTKLLGQQQATILVSHAYSCYDNAVTESFFNTLKTELVFWERYSTRREAHQSLFEYIEIFYNRQRRHSALGGRTPRMVEDLYMHP